MPEKQTMQRAARAKNEGKAPTTQAGEFVREEMHHVREGKHGARNRKQAVAIGLSKARRAGVKLGSPKRASPATRKKAAQDTKAGQKRTTRARKATGRSSAGRRTKSKSR